ncbi:MAG: glycolate oxidase subunit GlcF [Gammaproteobacteria bacterium]|nr:glycolate oxidase subunit GlcF [Gammaproteobacteria bacterium]
MQTQLPESVIRTRLGEKAQSILRRCVHCGFCNATCPTYQLLGDERDGPRGRIYLVKQWLEGEVAGEVTRDHLHRCLACQSCETTCPSGVDYLELVTEAKQALPASARYHGPMRLFRRMITVLVPRIAVLAPVLRVLAPLRVILPRRLARYLPRPVPPATPAIAADKQVILFKGCAQECFTPAVNASVRDVLARINVASVSVKQEQCCGALSAHMGDLDAARNMARANIDAWWPRLQAGAEAVVVSASGCAKFMKSYDKLLADDETYRDKAGRVAGAVRELVEQLANAELPAVSASAPRLAFHAPCTLKHGLKLDIQAETILSRAGFRLSNVPDSHLCCGAGGAYVLLHPRISAQLGKNKAQALESDTPDAIATANIGCQLQLERHSPLPVRHWVEWLAEYLPRGDKV